MKMKTIGALSLAIAASFPVSTQAQAPDAPVIEEITVTAQRREQTTMDVPISITAYQSADIERANMKGARDYIQMTPNVNFAESDRQGSKNGDISIRGISDLTAGGAERLIQTRPAVSVYVDDFAVSTVASGAANPPLDDLERVEILRGPQGTYFGRNSTGGAINITSKKPHEEVETRFSAGVGNYGTWNVAALGNLPVTENLYARVSASYDAGDGVVTNLNPTGKSADYSNINTRGALRYINDRWTVDLTGQFVKEDADNVGKIPTGIDPAGFLGSVTGGPTSDLATCGLGDSIFFPVNDEFICQDRPTFINIENDLQTLRVQYDAEEWQFVSVTGQIRSEMDQFLDLEQTGADGFNRANNYSTKSVSQEFRVASTGVKTIDWTVGAFFYDDELQANNTIISGFHTAAAFGGGLTKPGDFPNENSQNVERNGWAVFADIAWHFSDTMTLAVGGRYSYDEDKQFWTDTYASFDCGARVVVGGVPDPLLPGCELRPDQMDPLPIYDVGGTQFVTGGRFAQTLFTSATDDSNNFSPRIALNWSPNDNHSYFANLSQGYRPGGVRVAPDALGRDAQLDPANAVDNRSFYNEETVTSFELGWKGYFNNRRTRLEVSLFRTDWEDMQVRIARSVCRLPDGTFVDTNDPQSVNCVAGPFPDNSISNADEARSQGIEIAAQTLIGDNIEIGFAAGFLDATFESFPDSEFGDISGLDLPNAPERSLLVHGQYNFEIGNAESYIRVDAVNRADTYTRFQDVLQTGFPYRTGDYTLVNLQAGLEWENQRLNLAVANLFEEDYHLGVDSFSGVGVSIQPHPRMVSLVWTIWSL